MFTDAQVKEYAATKGYLPGTILWATDKSLDEDAFRSGNKTSAAIDFLRWQDIGLEDTRGSGRIPLEEQGGHFVTPGRGISLFIKRMLPEGMIYAGTSPEANKSDLMNTLSSIMNAETNPLYLTSLQLSHTIVAIQEHMEYLLKKAEEDPEGGEHEDYLIAQSILAALKSARQRVG